MLISSTCEAVPCDELGNDLPPHTPPPPPEVPDPDDEWDPFNSRRDFDFAWYHFVEQESSADLINKALDQWAADLLSSGTEPPWESPQDLYASIDAIRPGAAAWKLFKVKYEGPRPPGTPPKWMTETYEFCLRDTRVVLHQQMAMTEFKDKVNYTPYMQFNPDGKRIYSNFMSGEWVWKKAVSSLVLLNTYAFSILKTCYLQDEISVDPATLGAMMVAMIAGSDKTTVSVGTGHQEYYPVYATPGILINTARRAHGSAVLPVGFLPIPKSKSLVNILLVLTR